jgi:hypothetical protein
MWGHLPVITTTDLLTTQNKGLPKLEALVYVFFIA